MLKVLVFVLACVSLLAAPVLAADYKCAGKDTAVKLNDYDITIKNRETAIAEMQDEIKDGGGATEQHRKVLEAFQQKLASAKADRDKLLGKCTAK